MWRNKEINLGNIEPSTSHTVEFIYDGDKQIVKATASCGCTVPTITKNGIKVTYKADKLEMSTRINVTKTITVFYKDHSKDTLTIKGVITYEEED